MESRAAQHPRIGCLAGGTGHQVDRLAPRVLVPLIDLAGPDDHRCSRVQASSHILPVLTGVKFNIGIVWGGCLPAPSCSDGQRMRGPSQRICGYRVQGRAADRAWHHGPVTFEIEGTRMTMPFEGVIKLDVRDSVPDWRPYELKKAPEGAPNILIVLYDDTGLAAWSPYGGRINMPDPGPAGRQRADLHPVAHHRPVLPHPVDVPDRPQPSRQPVRLDHRGIDGLPRRRRPAPGRVRDHRPGAAGQRLRTFWLGKNHNVPVEDISPGGSRSEWPLSKGFDRFYGFLGGETNQWYPDLVEDNRAIEPPYTPGRGLPPVQRPCRPSDQDVAGPSLVGPVEAVVHVVLPGCQPCSAPRPAGVHRQVQGRVRRRLRGLPGVGAGTDGRARVLPEGTELTPLNPMPEDVANEADDVRPWAELNDDEKKLFCRMAEVFAGFSEYTDVQVGRIIDFLERTEQLDNTLVLYCADNGASGEGTPNGSVNENKFFNGFPDSLEENMSYFDELGSPETYNHYPTGWAVAFSTPFQMFKRYSQFAGGTCDPLVIHWPKGIKAKGEVRHHTITPPTSCRQFSMSSVWRCPRCIGVWSSTRSTGCPCATASTKPTRRPPRSASTSRCWVPAASGRRDGKLPRCTHRSAARAISIRTAGSSTTSTPTAPKRATLPMSIRRSCRSSSPHGSRKPRRTLFCPLTIGLRSSRSTMCGRRASRRAPATSTTPTPHRCRSRQRSISAAAPTRSWLMSS